MKKSLTNMVRASALAVLVSVFLAACGAVNPTSYNEAYLVTANVKNLDCANANVDELQATADYIDNASSKATSDIMSLNKGLTSLEPLRVAINDKIKECGDVKASAQPSTSASPSASAEGGTIGVVQPDGSLDALPVVGTEGVTLTSADTTANPQTPATFKDVRATCGVDYLLKWSDLVDCVDKADAQWYITAVNDRAKYTGFAWSDVQKWANDPQLDSSSQLVIQVYGNGFTDEQARAIALDLVGDETLVAKLSIVRHPSGFANTWSKGDKKVGDFFDRRTMVRVSLSPVVYNTDGTVRGIRGDAGIFIDCLNIWWKVVRTCEGVCTPPPPPPPCVTNCTPKDWSLSVTPPDGVNVQPNDPYEDRPELPASPAPVVSTTVTPSSDSQAQGATTPDPTRTIPTPATGTTSDGSAGSVNPTTGANLTDPGVPSVSGWG